jgi:cellulase/cellobiase CelA1
MLIATLVAAGVVVVPAAPALAKCPACRCLWQIQSLWPGGYQAQVTVTNLAAPAYDGWTVTWNFHESTTISAYWNAVVTTPGIPATAVSMNHTRPIPVNASVTFGFVARAAGTPRRPSFQVDRVNCPYDTP